MTIKVYSIPTCPWCEKLKAWLKKKKIEYEDRDVSESQNSQYREELLEKSHQLGVPVMDVNGQIIIGFKEKEIQEAIKKAEKDKPEDLES